MAQQNGGGDAFATAESVAASGPTPSSPDGYAVAAGDDPFAERPELLLGIAFLGGLLLAGLVSRFGR
jgi:hypothetical protein